MAANGTLIRKWFNEVWNEGREATIDDMCAKEAVGHGQTHDGSDIVGPEHFKDFWRAFRAAFTSMHVEIHQTIEQGEMAMARWTITMMHTGPFLSIESTGKRITATGMSVQRFAGGKNRRSLGQLGSARSNGSVRGSVAGYFLGSESS